MKYLAIKRVILLFAVLCIPLTIVRPICAYTGKVYVVDGIPCPVDKFERSGLTVYVPLNNPYDFHSGMKPYPSDSMGYGSFSRSTTAYQVNPETMLLENVPVNTPRFEKWNGKIGMLLEPATTNQMKWSEEFDQWTAFNGGATPNQTAAPNGENTADIIYENTANSQHYVNSSTTGFLPQSTVVCYSVYAKANTRTWLRLMAQTYGGTNPAGFFNLATGVVGTNSGASDIGIDAFGNGWYRCWMTFDTKSGVSNLMAYCGLANADNSGTYVGENKSLYAWGYQVEQYKFPTSYVATSAVTNTRAKEEGVPTYTLPNGTFDTTSAMGTAILFWNPLFDYDWIPVNNYSYGIVSVRDNSATSILRMHYSSAPAGRLTSLDNAATAPYVSINWTRNNWYKLVVKWGYLTSGISKFNVGFQLGSTLTWGNTGNFTYYNTSGNMIDFVPQTAIAPFLVRDFILFNRILTDSEIKQIGWLP